MFLYYGSTVTVTMSSGVTTTAPVYQSHVTYNSGPFVQSGTLSNTATTVVTGVNTASQTSVLFFNVYNGDSVANTFTVTSIVGGVSTILGVWTLQSGDTLEYVMGQGFRALDNNGRVKTGASLPSGNVVVAGFQPAIIPIAASGAVAPNTAATYMVTLGSAAALTIAAPTSGTSDGVKIEITSNTAYAHTVTATGLLQTGTANVNVATFAAQKGAGLVLMAYQGKFNVMSSVGITFS